MATRAQVQWIKDLLSFRNAKRRCAVATRRAERPALELLEDRLAPATLLVNSNADTTTADNFLTLREAIAIVNSGSTAGRSSAEILKITGTLGQNDTIQFTSSMNGQTITMSGPRFNLQKDLAIVGPGANLLGIDGGNARQHFFVDGRTNGPVEVEISGLTLRNGNASGVGGTTAGGVDNSVRGGSVFNDSAELTLTACDIWGNTAQHGGAVFILDGTTTILNTTIRGNTATVNAGGISISGGNVSVIQSTLYANTTTGTSGADGFSAGGIANMDGGSLSVIQSTIAGNTAANTGGVAAAGVGITTMTPSSTSLANTALVGNIVLNNPANGPRDLGGNRNVSGSATFVGSTASGGLVHGQSFNQVVSTTIAALFPAGLDTSGPVAVLAPVATSPLVDFGLGFNLPFPIQTDARGHSRFVDGPDANTIATIDVGAVEAASTAAPKIETFNLLTADPATASTLEILVSFNKPVTGVTLDDFRISPTNDVTSGKLVVNLTSVVALNSFGSQYRVSVRRVSGAGDLMIGFIDSSGSVRDSSNNPVVLNPANPGIGEPVPYVNSPAYSIPAAPPALVSIERLTPTDEFINPPADGKVTFKVTFSKDVTGVKLSNFEVVANVGLTKPPTLSGSGSVYFVTVNSVVAGTVGLNFRSIAGIRDLGGLSMQPSYTLGDPAGWSVPDGGSLTTIHLNRSADSFVDLVFNAPNENAVWTNRGNGDGTFQARTVVPLGMPATRLAVGDVNGDGIDDIAAGSSSSGLRVLLGQGNGSFSAPQVVQASGAWREVAVADVTGDGRADLVSTNGSAVYVLPGNGDGSFQSPQQYAAGIPHAKITVADVSGDGRPDIVSIGERYGSFSQEMNVLRSDGSGGFHPVQTSDVPGNVIGFTVADVSGDGRPDLIGGHQTSTLLSLSLGNGDGTFQPSTNLFSGSSSYMSLQPLATDIDGDGRIDILSIGSSSFDMFMNKGGGVFAAERVIPFAQEQFFGGGSGYGDLNNDGRLDAIGFDALSGAPRVLMSSPDTFVGPKYTITSATQKTTFAKIVTEGTTSFTYGENVTFKVTVPFQVISQGTTSTSSGSVAEGTVTLKVGSTVIAENVPMSQNGIAITVNSKTLSAGRHRIDAYYNGSVNYRSSMGSWDIDITPRVLLVTPNLGSKIYDGSVDSPLTPALQGQLVFGDTIDIDQFYSSANVGTQTVQTSAEILDGADGGNYRVTLGSATGSFILPREVVIVPDSASKVYDGHFALSGDEAIPQVVGLAAGMDFPFEVWQELDGSNVGSSIPVSAFYRPRVNSAGVPVSAELQANWVVTISDPRPVGVVTPRPLTVTLDNKSFVYGDVVPALTARYSGFVGTQGTGNLPQLPALSTAATRFGGAGTFAITGSGGNGGNYTYVFVPGQMSVLPAPLTIRADAKSKLYGDNLPAFTVSYSGFRGGDTPGSLLARPRFSSTADNSSSVGAYDILPFGASSPNYVISYGTGKLTVKPAPLVITAENQSMVAGSTPPELTIAYSGFVLGEDESALTQPAAVLSAVTSESQPGSYSIVVRGAASSNYAIKHVNGVFQVTTATRLVLSAAASSVAGTPVAVTVTVLDGDGNLDTSFNGFVRFTSTDAHASAVLPGELQLVAGQGTTNAVFVTAGLQTLTVIDRDGFSQRGEVEVDVAHAVPASLAFVQQPTAVSAGNVFSLPVKVKVLDAYGNLATDLVIPVTMTETGAGSFTAGSTATVSTVDGIATFDNLALTTSGAYMLRANVAGVPSVNSVSVTVGTLSHDLVVGGLLFRSYADPFAVNGSLRTNTSPVLVGFNPLTPDAFVPLLQLAGSTTIDTSTDRFSATGVVSSVLSGAATPLLGSITNAGIAALVGSGLSGLAGGSSFKAAGVDFTLSSLRFVVPSGGNGPELRLQGQIVLPVGLTAAVDGANVVRIAKTGITLTGVSASLTGTATLGGVTFSAGGLSVAYASSTSTFTITGASSATLGGIGAVAVNFGGGTTGGIIIAAGKVQRFDMAVVSSFAVAGVGFSAGSNLTLAGNAAAQTFTLLGGAQATVGGMGSFDVTFGFGNAPGLVLAAGALVRLDMAVNSTFTIGGASLITDNVRFHYTAASNAFDFDGYAQILIGGIPSFEVYLDTLKIQNGTLSELAMEVASAFTVGGITFSYPTDQDYITHASLPGLFLDYVASTNQFSLTGAASIAVGGISTRNGWFTQDSFVVTFGHGSTPGLVVTNGSLTSMALTIESDVIIGGSTLKTAGLALSYSAATSSFSIAGSTTIDIRGMNTFTATFGFGGTPGIVITGGALASLDMTLSSGSFQVGGVGFSQLGARLTYTGATRTFGLTGTASLTVGGITGTGGSGAPSFSVFFGGGGQPGIVLSDWALQRLDMTVQGSFTVAGAGFNSQGLRLTYDASTATSGTYTVTGGAAVTLGSAGGLSATFGYGGNPGIVITNGSLTSMDLAASLNLSIAGVGLTGNVRYGYNAARNSFTFGPGGVSLSVPGFDAPVSATLGRGSLPGISFSSGQVQSLALSMTSGFSFKGVSFSANDLGITYERSSGTVSFFGSTYVSISRMGSFGVSFGDGTTPGLVVSGGQVTKLDLAVTTDFNVAGVGFRTDGLRLKYESNAFKMTGGAGIQFAGIADLYVNFINQGLVITNGSLTSLNMRITSSFKIFNVTIGTSGLEFLYDAAQSKFAIPSGSIFVSTAESSLAKLDMTATFGTSRGPGLVIQNGSLQHLHIAINGSFELSKLRIEAKSLTIDYSYGLLIISGGAEMTVGPMTVGIAFPADDYSGGLVINPGTGEVYLESLYVHIKFDTGNAKKFSFEGEFLMQRRGGVMVYSASGKVGIPKIGDVGGTFKLSRYADGTLFLNEISLFYDRGSGFGIPIPGTGPQPVCLYLTHLEGKLQNIGADASNFIVSATATFNYGGTIDLDAIGIGSLVGSGTFAFFTATGSFQITASSLSGNYNWKMANGKLGSGAGSFDFNWEKLSFRASITSTMRTAFLDFTFTIGLKIQSNGATNMLGTVEVFINNLPPPFGEFINGTKVAGAGFYFQYDPNARDYVAGWFELGVVRDIYYYTVGWWTGTELPNTVGGEIDFAGAFYLISDPEVNAIKAYFYSNVGDGPIAGATIFVDANRNGLHDDDEPRTITDAAGQFDPAFASFLDGPIIALGGTDISTGLANVALMSAPSGSRQVSPFTTLVNELYLQSLETTEDQAKTLVVDALELPSTFDPLTDDSLTAALAGDAEAAATFAKQIQLANTAIMIASAQRGGLDVSEMPRLTGQVYATIASRILAFGGIDLNDPLVLRAIIEESALASGVTLDPAVALGTATLIAQVNGRIAAIPVAGDKQYLDAIVAVQVVGQGYIADQLTQVSAGTIGDLVADLDATIDGRIAAATIGTLQAPKISIGNQSQLVGGDDTVTTYEFTVQRDSTISPLLPVSVDYRTVDGSATAANGDYIPVSGTLTWAPGETGPKTILVEVAGRTGAQPAKHFIVELLNPTNAVVPGAGAAGGVILFGDAATTTTTLERVALDPEDSTDLTTTSGQKVGLRAVVRNQDDAFVPGMVGFYSGETLLGTSVVDPEDGAAEFSTTALAAGVHDLTARYLGVKNSAGDSLIGESVSGVVQQEVIFVLAPQTIVFNELSDMTYGDDAPGLFAASNAGLPVSYRVVSGPATLSGVELTVTGPGTVVVEAYQDGDELIGAAEPVQRSFTVNPANLTFTVDSITMVYGDALPTLTGTFSGFVGGDDAGIITVQPTLSVVDFAGGAGVYQITADGGELPAGYGAMTYNFGQLTVLRAQVVVVADDAMMVYGSDIPELTATYIGLVTGDDPGVLTTLPTLTTAAAGSGAGVYAISVSGAAADNYEFTYLPGILAITPATVTVRPDDMSKVYGDEMPTLTVSYLGLVNGDTPDAITTPPTLFTDALATSDVGTFVIEAEGAEAANYIFLYETGLFTITPATLEVYVNDVDLSHSYAGDPSGVLARYSGFVNGDSEEMLLSIPVVTADLAIDITTAFSGNYLVTFPGVKPTLTITPNNAVTTYGSAPTLTASYDGLLSGDDESDVPYIEFATAPVTAGVGFYDITITDAWAPDYTVELSGTGTLEIVRAPLVVSAATSFMPVGGSPSLLASYAGFVLGEDAAVLDSQPTLTTSADSTSDIGVYGVDVSGTADANYEATHTPGVLVVTPAPFTVGPIFSTEVVPFASAAIEGVSYAIAATPRFGTLTDFDPATGQATYVPLVAWGLRDSYSIVAIYTSSTNPAADATSEPIVVTIDGGTPNLIIAPDNTTTVYGTAPTVNVRYLGLVPGDTSSIVTGLVLSTPPVTAGVGEYELVGSGASAPGYNIIYWSRTLTITPAPLTVSVGTIFTPQGTLPTFTPSYDGFVNGDAPQDLIDLPRAAADVNEDSWAGVYPIDLGFAYSPNYEISYAAGVVVVTPALRTVGVLPNDFAEIVPESNSAEGLTYSIATPPEHGELTDFDPATGWARYVPDPDYVGPDSYSFVAAYVSPSNSFADGVSEPILVSLEVTTTPRVTAVTIAGDNVVGGNGSLRDGRLATLYVHFSMPVDVSHEGMTLTLSNGRTAFYSGLTNQNSTVVFQYPIEFGDDTDDLAVTSFDLNGVSLRDGRSIQHDADVSGAAVNPPGILRIDTAAPTATIERVGDPVQQAGVVVQYLITYSEPVVGVDLGDFDVQASMPFYLWSLSPGPLANQYLLEIASDPVPGTINLAGVYASDSAGNEQWSYSAGQEFTMALLTVPATIVNVWTYGQDVSDTESHLRAGRRVNFGVDFSESVVVDRTNGSPTLALSNGRVAQYIGGSGSQTLSFSHVIQPGDDAEDLAVLSLDRRGATIREMTYGLVNADLAGAAFNPQGVLHIDTVAPTATIELVQGATQKAGSMVQFLVTFSEPVSGVDFHLASDGVGAGIIGWTDGPEANQYLIDVATEPTAGTLGLDLVTANLRDLAGNRLASGSFRATGGATNTLGEGLYSLAVADLNGDGFPDVAAVNYYYGTVSVLLGSGDGSFSAAPDVNVGGLPTSVTLVDVSGDGNADLLVANYGSGTVNVLLGAGDGSFVQKSDVDFAGPGPLRVAVGDVDGDGRQDIVVSNWDRDDIKVLLGRGDGSFGAPSSFAAGDQPYGVTLADLNGDGVLDIAAANTDSDDVTVLLGQGDGSFVPAAGSPFAAGASPVALAIGDVNGDGSADIVAAARGSGEVIVLLGLGDGSFATTPSVPVGDQPLDVQLADLNRDGILDLIVADGRGDEIVTLLGLGSGLFGDPLRIPQDAGALPRAVAVADVDGDGAADILFGTYSGTLGVLHNEAVDQEGPAYTMVKLELVITPASATTVYGSAPTLSAIITGFHGGDDESIVTGLVLETVPPTTGVGFYDIYASGASAQSPYGPYDIVYNVGTLEITRAPLAITAATSFMPQGGSPSLAASYVGFVNGEDEFSLDLQPSLFAPVDGSSPVGVYVVDVSGAYSVNYEITHSPGVLVITPAPLNTVVFEDTPTEIALAAETAGVTYVIDSLPLHGVLSDFDPATGRATYTPEPGYIGPDSYSFVVNYSDSGNPAADAVSEPIFVAIDVQVDSSTLTITPNDTTAVYGSAPTLSARYEGFRAGDDESIVTGLVLSTAAVGTGVGQYPITASDATVLDYDIVYGVGTLEILAAPLTISSGIVFTPRGTAPTLPVSFAGFVLGEDESVLVTQPSVTTSATASSPVGVYSIDVAGASSQNYDITHVPGIVVVTPAPSSVAGFVDNAIDVGPFATPIAGLSYAIATLPVHGSLIDFDSATGQATYVPAPGYTGTDSYSFTVTYTGDASATSEPITVSIAVVGPTYFVDDDWAGLADSTVIDDADPVAAGDQIGVIGLNAFARPDLAITAIAAGTIVVNAGDYSQAVVINKPITLRLQEGPISFGSLDDTVDTAEIRLDGVDFTAGANGLSTQIDSALRGTGSLVKAGGGVLTLAGSSPVDYSGATTVADGTLALAKTTLNFLAGSIVIGDGDNNGQPANVKTAILRIDRDHQIAGADAISFVGGDGRLFLPAGRRETLAAPVDFAQGDVKIAGTLTTTGAYVQSTGSTTLTGSGMLIVGESGTLPYTLGSAGSAAALQGSGSIYTSMLTSHGTIDPSSGVTDADVGNATPGRITIRGNLQMTASSITNLDVGDVASDQLNVGINTALPLPAGSYSILSNYDLDPYLRGDVLAVTEPGRRGVNDIYNVNGTVRFHGTLNTRPILGSAPTTTAATMNFVWRALNLPTGSLDPREANLASVPSDFTSRNSFTSAGVPVAPNAAAGATRFEARFMGSAGQANAVGQAVNFVTKTATGADRAALTAPAYAIGQAKLLTLTPLTKAATSHANLKVTKQLWNAMKDSHTRVTVTVTNTTGGTLTGPFYLEIMSTPSGVAVFNQAGKTQVNNKPYLVVVPRDAAGNALSTLANGATATVEVDLLTPITLGKPSTLTANVLFGGMP